MRHEVVNVNPKLAVEWLSSPYDRQRRVSKKRVETYARAMAEGRWHEPTIDPIAFTADGLLLNGQHRLQAIVLTRLTVDMLVARDVPAEQFDVIDTPLTRTAYQFIEAENAATVAAAARVAMWYERRLQRPDGTTLPPAPNALQFDTHETLAYVAEHQEALAEAVSDAMHAYRGSGLPAGAHAGLIFLSRRMGADPDRLASWLDGLAEGVGLGENDSRRLLRKRFSDPLTGRQLRRHGPAVWMLMTRAFNAHMQDRAMAKLGWSSDDPVPVIDLTGKAQPAAADRRWRRQSHDHDRVANRAGQAAAG